MRLNRLAHSFRSPSSCGFTWPGQTIIRTLGQKHAALEPNSNLPKIQEKLAKNVLQMGDSVQFCLVTSVYAVEQCHMSCCTDANYTQSEVLAL